MNKIITRYVVIVREHFFATLLVCLIMYVLAFLPGLARASTLVSVDLNEIGDGLLTLDTATGLEWLDLTQTDLELSFNQMLVQLGPGGAFEGFRYATEAEVLTLLTNAGIDTSVFGTVNFVPVTEFQTLVGITDIGIGNVSDSFGLTSTAVGLPTCSTPCQRAIFARRFISGGFAGQAGIFLNTRATDQIGSNLAHWLVRLAPISVSVDIKPDGVPNSINLVSKEMIPVAILTTETFDALQVDWETVRFGPSGATERHERLHVRDTDGDGDMDAVLHFRVRDTGIRCGDTESMLTGETYAGEAFTGVDTINIVKCPKRKRR